MCFGCSKEPSHGDGSFEYPQHMFWLRNKKIIFSYALLSGGLLYILETCNQRILAISEYSNYAIWCNSPESILFVFNSGTQYYIIIFWEGSGSMVECLTGDGGAVGSSLTGITVLWSLSKTHLSYLSTGSTQEDPSLFN